MKQNVIQLFTFPPTLLIMIFVSRIFSYTGEECTKILGKLERRGGVGRSKKLLEDLASKREVFQFTAFSSYKRRENIPVIFQMSVRRLLFSPWLLKEQNPLQLNNAWIASHFHKIDCYIYFSRKECSKQSVVPTHCRESWRHSELSIAWSSDETDHLNSENGVLVCSTELSLGKLRVRKGSI